MGGQSDVDVKAAAGCSWSVTAHADWISIVGGVTGTGNGTVTFKAEKNTGSAARTGTFTVGGATFTVTEDGTGPGKNASDSNLLTP
jgi:hypothetical protein